jgi:hypothetical protein
VDADRLRVLGLLGVSHIMQPPDGRPFRVPGLDVVHDGPDARVYANRGAQPRAVVVGAQRVVAGGDAALAAITAPGFAFREEAVTEAPVAGVPEDGPAGRAGRARIRRIDPDRLVVDATATRPGMLVVSDAWDPGWTATVDGREIDVERVDYVMRGVPLPAGAHRVEFRYEPWSFEAGRAVSLVTLAGLAALALAGRRRRRA